MSRSVVAVTLRRSSVRCYRFHVTLALLMRRPCEKLSPSGLYGRVGVKELLSVAGAAAVFF